MDSDYSETCHLHQKIRYLETKLSLTERINRQNEHTLTVMLPKIMRNEKRLISLERRTIAHEIKVESLCSNQNRPMDTGAHVDHEGIIKSKPKISFAPSTYTNDGFEEDGLEQKTEPRTVSESKGKDETNTLETKRPCKKGKRVWQRTFML